MTEFSQNKDMILNYRDLMSKDFSQAIPYSNVLSSYIIIGDPTQGSETEEQITERLQKSLTFGQDLFTLS